MKSLEASESVCLDAGPRSGAPPARARSSLRAAPAASAPAWSEVLASLRALIRPVLKHGPRSLICVRVLGCQTPVRR